MVDSQDERRRTRLASSAPQTLVQKMLETKLSGERRMVSAVFADVVGSTSLMESIDPEDWTAIANVAFDLMSQAIYLYEGTIAQLQGDAMVAFFGAPVAHEDDPERAVRAALDMISSIEDYREQLKAAQGIDFRIRAGLNTGIVLVGKVGTDLRYEYTALGDTMNVAARMEAAARPGTVLVTHDTYRLVSATFDVQDLGAISVKGKSEPVHAYEVIGLRAEPAPKRGIAGLRSQMIGRDAEFDRLKNAFDLLLTGRGSLACIVGEPGIGKTRLAGEFKAWALSSGENFRWAEGHGMSYGRNFPYHLVLDLLRSCIGVSTAASREEASESLKTALSTLPAEDRTNGYAALGHLMSLPIPQADVEFFATMDPEQLQKRYLGGMKLLTNALASLGPLVMVLEDLHWADAASTQILTWLLAVSAHLPILVCLTSRPEDDAPGWQLVEAARHISGRDFTEIRLEPLSEDDSRELMASLLEIESLPQQVREKLLKRGEGNPFFVEELIKVLIDRGVIVREGPQWVATREAATVEIPDTLRGLLLARIDRLEESARHTLKVASVVGRQFPLSVLGKVLEASEPARDSRIDELEATGLIKIAAVDPEIEYRFRHSLVQETAYESLLKRERKSLHLLVGEAIEQLYELRRQELAPELAFHFEEAEDERALKYLMAAAELARNRFAVHEARSFYDRVQRLLSQRDDPSLIRTSVEVAVERVEVGWTFSEPEGEIAALEEVIGSAESLGDDRLLVRLYSLGAMLRQFHGEQYGTSPALTLAIDRANEISKTVDDPSLRAGPLTQMGWALTFMGQVRRGLSLLEEAVPLLERQGKLIDLGITLDGLAFDYNRLGELKLSDDRLKRAEELAEEGDPIAKLDFLAAKAGIMFFRNDLDAAMEAAHLCASKSDEMGVVSCSIGSHLTIGMVHIMRGNPSLALPNLERSAELSTVSLKFWLPLIGAARATAEAMLGRMKDAEAGWQTALERARAMGDSFVEGMVLNFRGWVSSTMTNPDWESILPDLEDAIRLFERLEMRLFVARALKDFGSALKSAGRPDEAREALSRALDQYEAMELTQQAEVVRALF